MKISNFENMTTTTIIHELERMSLSDKLFVIEHTIKSIRTEKEKKLKTAVEALYSEYKNNKELTAFTALDNQPFYETR